MSGSLAGIRVLDLSRMYPGAFCTVVLADLGADVVKIEAPGFGDGMRAMSFGTDFNAAHTALNRGKRSVVLDLRKPEGADVFRRLVADADVVVESHKPGALDAGGIGCDAMRQINPRLVWCSLTGFGSSGPNAHAAGHDITYVGYAGLMPRLSQHEPSPPGVGVSLPVAALTAAVGILAALQARHTTGVGSRVDANMVESAMWMLSEDFARAANSPMPGWGTMASRGVYRCADGRYVTVASNEPRTWATLCEALDVPELAAHRIGADPEPPAIARLTEVFTSRPAGDWCRSPGLAGGVGPVNEPSDLLTDGQITERAGMVSIDGTSTRVLASPIRLDGADGAAATLATAPPPELGADTVAVLAAAGYSDSEIEALRSAGAAT
jgi:crotonobetainyl-CoA:carnitine CoA-transferase CaiB-like acyl-CoA transferase